MDIASRPRAQGADLASRRPPVPCARVVSVHRRCEEKSTLVRRDGCGAALSDFSPAGTHVRVHMKQGKAARERRYRSPWSPRAASCSRRRARPGLMSSIAWSSPRLPGSSKSSGAAAMSRRLPAASSSAAKRFSVSAASTASGSSPMRRQSARSPRSTAGSASTSGLRGRAAPARLRARRPPRLVHAQSQPPPPAARRRLGRTAPRSGATCARPGTEEFWGDPGASDAGLRGAPSKLDGDRRRLIW